MLGTSFRQRPGTPVSGEDCCCRGKCGISCRLSCRKCGLIRYHVGRSISYWDGSRKTSRTAYVRIMYTYMCLRTRVRTTHGYVCVRMHSIRYEWMNDCCASVCESVAGFAPEADSGFLKCGRTPFCIRVLVVGPGRIVAASGVSVPHRVTESSVASSDGPLAWGEWLWSSRNGKPSAYRRRPTDSGNRLLRLAPRVDRVEGTQRASRGARAREHSAPQLARGPRRRVEIAEGALRGARRNASTSNAGRGPVPAEERGCSGNFTDAHFLTARRARGRERGGKQTRGRPSLRSRPDAGR
jgi:hypothetical protein